MIAVAYCGGLRRQELVAALVSDWNPDEHSLKVHGKGRREREVWLDPGAARAVEAWLAVRERRGPGALFCRFTSNGRGGEGYLTAEHLSGFGIYKAMKLRAVEAGIPDFMPHSLRRTMVTTLLERGEDLVTVQRRAGHARVETTARYDRRGAEAQKKAAAKLATPFDP